MASNPPKPSQWIVTMPTVSQIHTLAHSLCEALVLPPKLSTTLEDTSITSKQQSQISGIMQRLNGPSRSIPWQQNLDPNSHSAIFILFPQLPTELRLKIWRHAYDSLRFPGTLGSGTMPMSVYGEPRGLTLACLESNSIISPKMKKCIDCRGTWISPDTNSNQFSNWRDVKFFAKGSKYPCISCHGREWEGEFSMRVRYLMHYGNIWSEGLYHSTFLIMGKRIEGSDALTFVLPHFVENRTGKGILKKISVLQEDPERREREAYSFVLIPDINSVWASYDHGEAL